LENDDVEGMWVDAFNKSTRRFLIWVYYRPPDTSTHLPTNFNGVFNVNLKQDERKDFKALVRLYGFT
jgi:hypothetical protein